MIKQIFRIGACIILFVTQVGCVEFSSSQSRKYIGSEETFEICVNDKATISGPNVNQEIADGCIEIDALYEGIDGVEYVYLAQGDSKTNQHTVIVNKPIPKDWGECLLIASAQAGTYVHEVGSVWNTGLKCEELDEIEMSQFENVSIFQLYNSEVDTLDQILKHTNVSKLFSVTLEDNILLRSINALGGAELTKLRIANVPVLNLPSITFSNDEGVAVFYAASVKFESLEFVSVKDNTVLYMQLDDVQVPKEEWMKLIDNPVVSRIAIDDINPNYPSLKCDLIDKLRSVAYSLNYEACDKSI